MGLSAKALHQDQSLTNVSVMFTMEDGVATEVFPELPVDKQTGKYFKWGTENLLVSDDTYTPGAISKKFEWSVSLEDYNCGGHAEHTADPGWMARERRPGDRPRHRYDGGADGAHPDES